MTESFAKFDEEFARMNETEAREEFATPWKSLNEPLGGGQMRGEFTVLGGRPSTGKSTFVFNMIHNLVAKRKKKVFFASLEMGIYQVMARLLSINTGVWHRSITMNRLNDNEARLVAEARAIAEQWPLEIYDTSDMTYRDLEAIAEEGSHDAIFVDYLQLVNTVDDDHLNRYEKVGLVSRSMKKISRERNIPVLALAQMRRPQQTRVDKAPTMDELRESGNIEQDADNIWLLHEKSNNPMSKQAGLDLIVAKNRNGPRVGCSLIHHQESAIFEDEQDAIERERFEQRRYSEFDEWS